MIIDRVFTVDTRKAIAMSTLRDELFLDDENAHRIVANVVDREISGNAAGYFVRADGYTVLLDGVLDDPHNVSVVLSPQCYDVPGYGQVCIRLTDGDSVTTLLAVSVKVRQSKTDAIIDPEHVIPSLDELLAKIADLERATADAERVSGPVLEELSELKDEMVLVDDTDYIEVKFAEESEVNRLEYVVFETITTEPHIEIHDAEMVTSLSGYKPIYNTTYNLFMMQSEGSNVTKIYKAKSGTEYLIHGYGNNEVEIQPIALFSPILQQVGGESFSAKDGEKFIGDTSTHQYWDKTYTPSIDGYFYVRGGSSSVTWEETTGEEIEKVEKKKNGVYVKNGVITHFTYFSKNKILCREFKRFRINNLIDIFRMYVGKIENGEIELTSVLGTSDGDTIGPISIHRKDIDSWVGQWSGGVHGKTISGVEYPTAEQKSLSVYCDGNEITVDGLYFGDVSIIAKNDLYFPQSITGANLNGGVKAIEETRRYTLTDKMEVDVTIAPAYAEEFACNRYYGCQFYAYDCNRLYAPNSESTTVINPPAKFNFAKQENTVIMEAPSGATYSVSIDDFGLGTFKYNDGSATEAPYGYFETFNKGYFVPVGNKNVYMRSGKVYKWHGVYDYKMP